MLTHMKHCRFSKVQFQHQPIFANRSLFNTKTVVNIFSTCLPSTAKTSNVHSLHSVKTNHSQQHNVHSQIPREVPWACLCPFQFIFQSRPCDRKDNPVLRDTWQKWMTNEVCNTHTWLAYSQHMFLPHPCLHRQPPPLPEQQPRGSTVETQKPIFRHYEHCYSTCIRVRCIFSYSVLQHYLEIGI